MNNGSLSQIPSVFISYKHDDNAHFVVQYLLHRFKKEGLSGVWFDGYIPFGAKWQQELEDKLGRCVALVAVVTPNYQSSLYCNYEWGVASGRGIKVFPLKVHTESRIQPPLDMLQYMDCSRDTEDVSRLIREIKDHVNELESAGKPVQIHQHSLVKLLREMAFRNNSRVPNMLDFLRELMNEGYVTPEQQSEISDIISQKSYED